MRLRPGAVALLFFSLVLLVFFGGRTSFLLFLFLILLGLLGYFLTFKSFSRLKVERRVSPRKLLSGDDARIELLIENLSPMPIPWLEIRDNFQPFMIPNDGPPRFALSLRGKERRTISYSARLKKRGEYFLRPLVVSVGDPWGFWRKEGTFDAPASLVVFPPVLPISSIRLPLRKPFEGRKSGIRAYEDYTAISGLREYLPFDPLKRVHWKVTAHLGKLMVKDFEFSSSTTLAVWLDLVSTGHGKNFMEVYEEFSCMIAASILHYASLEHIPTLLTVFPRSENSASLGRGQVHFLNQMDVLARAKSAEGELLEEMGQEAPHLPWQANLVLISSLLTRQTLLKLVELKLRIRHLSLFLLYEGSFLLPGEKPRYNFLLDPIEVSELRRMSGLLEEQNISVHLIGGNEPLEAIA